MLRIEVWGFSRRKLTTAPIAESQLTPYRHCSGFTTNYPVATNLSKSFNFLLADYFLTRGLEILQGFCLYLLNLPVSAALLLRFRVLRHTCLPFWGCVIFSSPVDSPSDISGSCPNGTAGDYYQLQLVVLDTRL